MRTEKLFKVTLTGTRKDDGEKMRDVFLTELPHVIIPHLLGFDGVTTWERADTEEFL